METIDRRRFIVASAASAAGVTALGMAGRAGVQPGGGQAQPRGGAQGEGDAHRGAALICSANGQEALRRAMELIGGGTYILDAIVAGVKIVEDDPADDSVGYGGLPNEECIVQLDASVMDGPLHRAGSVGAIERIKNPAAVALALLRNTDHVMIVGEGALKFARRMGFKEEDLLTEHARREWLTWRANLNAEDKWLDDDQKIKAPAGPTGGARGDSGSHRLFDGEERNGVRYTTGTIHCSGVDGAGNVAAVTSTSGLSWKLSGRLGDSPIVGAGMYCDNAIGSAGATGRGEAVMQVCGAFSIVQHMEAGMSPTEACMAVVKRIADRTREKRLLDGRGRPNFDVKVYAVRKDGAYGSASIWNKARFAVHDGSGVRLAPCAFLFEK